MSCREFYTEHVHQFFLIHLFIETVYLRIIFFTGNLS